MLDLDNATKAKGSLVTVSGNNVNVGQMNLSATRIRVPTVFKEAMLNNMPQTMAVFDKYKRPFNVRFSSLVETTHGGEKNFRNDLYNFSRPQAKKEIYGENFSFSYAPSAYKNDDSGMGIVEASYKTKNRETSFSFSENTRYSSGSYNDSAMFNPYLAMNEAYGLSHKMKYNKFNIKMGFYTGENGLYDGDRRYHDYNFDNQASAFDIAATYQITPELNLTTMLGTLNEQDAVLGIEDRKSVV